MTLDHQVGADPTLAWFDHLARAGNSRELWAAQKGAYATDVRAPFTAYLAVLDAAPGVPSHGPWRVYRPHNDLRFSRDGEPLKTFIGAIGETPGGAGLYTQVDSAGLLVAAGMPWLAPDQLAAWRAVVADPVSGSSLAEVVQGLQHAGLRVRGGRPEPLRRVPRDLPADHPRAEWLRWKGVEALARHDRQVWSDTARRTQVAAAALTAASPLLSWLERHIGRSALPRPRR
jgi:uncharacterized protein (DUF2461 family)